MNSLNLDTTITTICNHWDPREYEHGVKAKLEYDIVNTEHRVKCYYFDPCYGVMCNNMCMLWRNHIAQQCFIVVTVRTPV